MRAAFTSTLLALLASVVSAEKCCLCDNCESPLGESVASTCQDAVDALDSLSANDHQCVHLQASFRDHCCAPTAVAPNIRQRKEEQRHLQYSTCHVCVDGRAPGRPCGGRHGLTFPELDFFTDLAVPFSTLQASRSVCREVDSRLYPAVIGTRKVDKEVSTHGPVTFLALLSDCITRVAVIDRSRQKPVVVVSL